MSAQFVRSNNQHWVLLWLLPSTSEVRGTCITYIYCGRHPTLPPTKELSTGKITLQCTVYRKRRKIWRGHAWATICTSLSHSNISTQKTHRFTCTPHNIHELTLTKAQACTHTAYAQHSHRFPQLYTETHKCPDTSEHTQRAWTSLQGQRPLAFTDLKLGHWTRSPELTAYWNSAPTSSCSVNCFCQRLPSPSCLERHPSEVAWSWGQEEHSNLLIMGLSLWHISYGWDQLLLPHSTH